MKKAPIAILILVLILILSGGDYLLNTANNKTPEPVTIDTPDNYPNLTQTLIEGNPATLDYQISKRNRTTQIFEKIDLTALGDIRVYRSEIKNPVLAGQKEALPIVVYEIQGAEKQGAITYLNVKLQFVKQMDATENINESSDFGGSSFYFNDLNNRNTSFLCVRIGDNLFGFQFSKVTREDFDTIKQMIDTLLDSFNS